jgi:type IV pilus assembly protein PilA
MFSRKGFTLVELMVVILIVAILAGVAIPIMRGRIDAAKWSEGKAGAGTIATAIRGYAAEKGPAGTVPTTVAELGFTADDLKGTYFAIGNYSVSNVTLSPLAYTITVTKGTGITTPSSISLDQTGTWTETP